MIFGWRVMGWTSLVAVAFPASMTNKTERGFFDSHCHLDFAPFGASLDAHLEAFHKAGIRDFLIPSVGPDNWQTLLAIKAQQPVYIALGYHPCFLPDSHNQTALEQALEDCAALVAEQRSQVSAWGECGLDGRFKEGLDFQELAFRSQVALANTHQLPLIVHSVREHDRCAQVLRQQQAVYGGIIHAFSGSYQQAARFVDLGFKLGIGGTITWPRSEKTRKAIKRLPLDALVLETDAPDMPLYQMQTDRNTPLNLPQIFQTLCELRDEPAEQLKEALWCNTQNALRLVGAID